MATTNKTLKTAMQGLVIAIMLVSAANAQIARNRDNMAPTGKGWGALAANDANDSDGADNFGAPRTVTAPRGNGIQYHGGPVMSGNVNVYFIWYGNWSGGPAESDSPMTVSLLNSLYGHSRALAGSASAQIASTYTDRYRRTASNNFSLVQSTSDDYSRGKNLTDAAVAGIVASAVQNGRLPKDPNGIYFVLTSSDVNETSGLCRKYCGWHDHKNILGSDLKLAFIGNPDRCADNCEIQSASPNGNPGADAMASIMVHETLETVTDPDLNAWYDSQGQEVGDKCAWTYGPVKGSIGNGAYNQALGGHNWLIQMSWVNANGGGCAQAKGGKFYNY